MINLGVDTSTSGSFYDPVQKGYYVLKKDGVQHLADKELSPVYEFDDLSLLDNKDSTKI